MRICQGNVAGSGVIFREDFASWTSISDNGGIVVASALPTGGGISPTGISGRVTYGGTEALLINATQMTVEMRFKAGTARAVLCPIVVKGNATTPDYQFLFLQGTGNEGVFYVPTAANDAGTYNKTIASYVTGTEYVVHAVFNGALAAASRAAIYKNGLLDPSTMFGTIPAVIRANAIPLTLFNYQAFAANSPSNDFILRRIQIYNFALSAADVALAAVDRLNLGVL